MARLLVLLLMAAAISFTSVGSASAYSCAGDYQADGNSWRDNQWWGDACPDNHGEMLRAVQLIITLTWPFYTDPDICGWPTDDGYWGPITKSSVTCYQDYKGLTADGIVGPDTWGQRSRSPYTGLMSELTYTGTSGGKQWYRTDWVWDQFYMTISTGSWWLISMCDSTYVPMYVNGPLDDCD